MNPFAPVSTPYGKGIISARQVDKDGNQIGGWCVRIKRADYQRNYPGIPNCDGTHIYITCSEDQVREIGA